MASNDAGPILVVGEQELGARTTLEALWAGEPTFILAPEKVDHDALWLASALQAVPAALSRRHFGLLTSGSTGEPKLVLGARDRAEALARVLHVVQRSDPVETAICVLPLSYSYSFVNQWLWSSVHGRSLVRPVGFADPAGLADELARARNAMLCLVGAQVPLLARLMGDRAFPGVIRVHFAGGRFPQEHLPLLRTMFPSAEVFNNYGCAEAMPRLTVRPAEAVDNAANVGRPIPGVRLRATEMGQLEFNSDYGAVAVVAGGRATMIGPEAWTFTGDLARPEEDGSWTLSGRDSEVYKRFGEKISIPAVLAAVTRAWPGGSACYRTTDRMGESAHVVVLSPEPAETDIRRVLGELRRSFTRAHWPLRIESRPELPLLANGKPDVRRLAEESDVKVHWTQRY